MQISKVSLLADVGDHARGGASRLTEDTQEDGIPKRRTPCLDRVAKAGVLEAERPSAGKVLHLCRELGGRVHGGRYIERGAPPLTIGQPPRVETTTRPGWSYRQQLSQKILIELVYRAILKIALRIRGRWSEQLIAHVISRPVQHAGEHTRAAATRAEHDAATHQSHSSTRGT